jgi:hypothetical protein
VRLSYYKHETPDGVPGRTIPNVQTQATNNVGRIARQSECVIGSFSSLMGSTAQLLRFGSCD